MEAPSSYRSICLINETGKMLEKAVTDGIWEHLDLEGPNISEDQYGFRAGRSTIEAISRVISLACSAMFRGGVALAVSLNIINAFNFLP